MLIIKIIPEREGREKLKGKRKKQKQKNELIKRFSVNINTTCATVLELPCSELKNPDIEKLFKIYKGRILLSENAPKNTVPEEYLFNPKPYFNRALLSALSKQMIFLSKDNRSFCLKYPDFSPTVTMSEIVRYARSFTLITPKSTLAQQFKEECYETLGAIITVKEEEPNIDKFDVFADFTKTDENAKLIMTVKGKDAVLYPDPEFFRCKNKIDMAFSYGINEKIACAAFAKI